MQLAAADEAGCRVLRERILEAMIKAHAETDKRFATVEDMYADTLTVEILCTCENINKSECNIYCPT